METSKERLEELWSAYRAYYLQANDGIDSANVYVFEHAVKEIRLMDEIDPDGTLTEEDICRARDMSVNVIQTLLEDGKVPVNNISSQVECRNCKKFQKGVIRTVNLPCGEIYEHERVCYVCA
jgi:hypothetical protein